MPFGKGEEDNPVIEYYLEPTSFTFTPKDHVALGEIHDLFDFTRASKIAKSRFVVTKGLGARLERALISFMMDLHANLHGYTEMIPPYIVSSESMYATGQLPKFRDDSFAIAFEEKEYYLNPTAEVPTINYYRNEILPAKDLPIKFCSYTTAFRSEAGSAGKDTKGILRLHQFNKVELIAFCLPEQADEMLEGMLNHAKTVLERLEIPYRVVKTLYW